MKNSIEKRIEKYFPEKWGIEDVKKVISPRFELDIEAIDEALNQPIRSFILRGGKRIRPLLFLTLLKGFGKDPEEYTDVAVAIELIHNGTLVVDDIEDRSELRRGKPTLHKEYSLDIALNAGNALYFLPLKVISQKKQLSQSQKGKLNQIYCDEMINVHIGQATDIHWHNAFPDSITPEKYLEMSRLKTGSLTRMAVRFAATLTDQSKVVEKSLIDFAESAGIAFQIRDDILDLTADTDKFGKAHGNDITEGKVSLPVIFALQELDAKEQKRLKEILHMHTRDPKIINEATQIMSKTSAIKQSMQRAEEMLSAAWQAVESKVPAGEGRDLMQQLAISLTKRDH